MKLITFITYFLLLVGCSRWAHSNPISVILDDYGRALLTWDANGESDLAGYKAYAGLASRNYSLKEDTKVNNYTFSGLERGRLYYFAATAYDNAGNESEYSSEASLYVPLQAQKKPSPPEVSIINTQMKLDTALISDKIPIRIVIEPKYDDGSQLNPTTIDSIQIDIRRFESNEIVVRFIVESAPNKIQLQSGKHYLNASLWKDGQQSDWPTQNRFFLIDEFTSRIVTFEIPIEVINN